MSEIKNKDSIYPQLPSAPDEDRLENIERILTEIVHPKVSPAPEDEGQAYRLHKINQIQQYLESEKRYRNALYKKYKKGAKAVNIIDTGLVTVSMGLGTAGIGLMANVLTVPISLVLHATAVGTGLLSVVGKYIDSKLSTKAKKHNNIMILAEAKLNTIRSHISQALINNKISDYEFELIMSEVEKYEEMKKEIRVKNIKALHDSTDDSYVEKTRKRTRNNFRLYYDDKFKF